MDDDYPPPETKSRGGDNHGSEADETYKAFVGGLSYMTEGPDLERAFKDSVGGVLKAHVVKDPEGRSKGFGFVTFESDDCVRLAIDKMNGVDLDGKIITVNHAVKKSDRDRDYRPRRDFGPRMPGRGYGRESRGGPKPMGYRVQISNLPDYFTWRELKDLLRTSGGDVTYADVKRPGFGIGEYASYGEREDAIRRLDGKVVEGQGIRVDILEEGREPGGSRYGSASKGDSYGYADDRYGDAGRESAYGSGNGGYGSGAGKYDRGSERGRSYDYDRPPVSREGDRPGRYAGGAPSRYESDRAPPYGGYADPDDSYDAPPARGASGGGYPPRSDRYSGGGSRAAAGSYPPRDPYPADSAGGYERGYSNGRGNPGNSSYPERGARYEREPAYERGGSEGYGRGYERAAPRTYERSGSEGYGSEGSPVPAYARGADPAPAPRARGAYPEYTAPVGRPGPDRRYAGGRGGHERAAPY